MDTITTNLQVKSLKKRIHLNVNTEGRRSHVINTVFVDCRKQYNGRKIAFCSNLAGRIECLERNHNFHKTTGLVKTTNKDHDDTASHPQSRRLLKWKWHPAFLMCLTLHQTPLGKYPEFYFYRSHSKMPAKETLVVLMEMVHLFC